MDVHKGKAINQILSFIAFYLYFNCLGLGLLYIFHKPLIAKAQSTMVNGVIGTMVGNKDHSTLAKVHTAIKNHFQSFIDA